MPHSTSSPPPSAPGPDKCSFDLHKFHIRGPPTLSSADSTPNCECDTLHVPPAPTRGTFAIPQENYPNYPFMPTAAVKFNPLTYTMEISIQKNSLLLASVFSPGPHDPYSRWIWTPATCVEVQRPGVFHIRIWAGPCVGQEYSNVVNVMPFTVDAVGFLRRAGQVVEKNGLKEFFGTE
ncbi:hypothetical protein B0H34DRAFT_518951 [Crassisporium funariophilum]|nr:hypothetical protein B0H34DRAFT_518951 [Crassisporium funariophilum]